MSERTLVFTATYPFNEDYALKYGFDILKRRGFKLKVFNVSSFLLPEPEARRRYGSDPLAPVAGVEQVHVRTPEELESRLRALPGWKLVLLASFKNVTLLRAISRAGVGYVELYANLMPTPEPGCRARLTGVLKKLVLRPGRFWEETVLKRLPKSWVEVEPPRFVVRGSEAAPDSYPPQTVRINAHSFDYDRYLRNGEVARHPEAPAGEYFVHLECPPWECHDYVVLGLKAVVGKDEYAALVNRFFDFVERKTGKKIVIAAHPKHTRAEDVYGGRPFLYGTEELVRHASGVFCHYSGALKFAVIHRRPLCFLNSRRLADDAYFQMNLRAYAEGLRAPVRLIDEPAEREEVLSRGFYYDEGAYDEYMRRFVVCRPQKERLLWDIVADELEAAAR